MVGAVLKDLKGLGPLYAKRVICTITVDTEKLDAYYKNPCASTLEGVFCIDGKVRCCTALPLSLSLSHDVRPPAVALW